MNEGHYLALDWGESKIGMALADGETRIAYAHKIAQSGPKALAAIGDVIATHDVRVVIVGVPAHAGHENNGTRARDFAAALAAQFPAARVQIVDEMFTTKMARAGRVAAGKKGGDDDAEAARILLQEWLDASDANV